MTKLNLVNSLIFALALQSSVNIVAGETNDANNTSYFTKKNVAIAAVTLVAGYELAKMYQATNTINVKAFCKEVLELNKKDFSTISGKFKNLGATVKNNTSYYGNKTLGYIKTPFSYMNGKRLDFIKKLQMQKATKQFNELASGTSKVAELDNNFIELVNEFGKKCPLQIW